MNSKWCKYAHSAMRGTGAIPVKFDSAVAL
jgi:hypothetical protein